jgi:hypothetical protein
MCTQGFLLFCVTLVAFEVDASALVLKASLQERCCLQVTSQEVDITNVGHMAHWAGQTCQMDYGRY